MLVGLLEVPVPSGILIGALPAIGPGAATWRARLAARTGLPAGVDVDTAGPRLHGQVLALDARLFGPACVALRELGTSPALEALNEVLVAAMSRRIREANPFSRQ